MRQSLVWLDTPSTSDPTIRRPSWSMTDRTAAVLDDDATASTLTTIQRSVGESLSTLVIATVASPRLDWRLLPLLESGRESDQRAEAPKAAKESRANAVESSRGFLSLQQVLVVRLSQACTKRTRPTRKPRRKPSSRTNSIVVDAGVVGAVAVLYRHLATMMTAGTETWMTGIAA